MPLPNSWQFDAIGTHWTIWTQATLSKKDRLAIGGSVETFDRYYSRFRDDSLISNPKKSHTLIFPEDSQFDELFAFYEEMYELTHGAVTPLVADTLSSLGYDKGYSLIPDESVVRVKTIDEMIEWDGAFSIRYKEPVMLDFGAAGKGLLVDRIGEMLNEAGHKSHVIDASGDMLHRSQTPYRIGLEDPDDNSSILGTVELSNEPLCGSSTNRRMWGDGLHHVIDGRTSRPTNDIVATWVLGTDSTMKADGMATVLFFVEGIETLDHYDGGYLRIRRDGTIEMNQKMSERVTLFTG